MEQGGYKDGMVDESIYLLKSLQTPYIVHLTSLRDSGSGAGVFWICRNQDSTQFEAIYYTSATGYTITGVFWKACGYIS